MVIVASFSCVKLIEGKKTGDHRNWHVGRVGSQDVESVGWIDDSSDRNIELSGRMENKADDCAGRAYLAALSSPAAIAAAVVTILQSVGDCGQPPLEFSLAVRG